MSDSLPSIPSYYLRGTYAVVGLGSAPGIPDTLTRQTARRAVAIAYLESVGAWLDADAWGQFEGTGEPCVIFCGCERDGNPWDWARTLGRALSQACVLLCSDGLAYLGSTAGETDGDVTSIGRVYDGPSPTGDWTRDSQGRTFHAR